MYAISYSYTPTDSTSTTPQSTVNIPIGIRGIIGICSVVFILLIYCCFALVVAIRELSKMKRRRKKIKHTVVNESDLEDDFDNDEQIDEINVQVQSNDLLLTNEYAIKNEVAKEPEAVVSSRPAAVVAKARPSISVTRETESKTEKGQDQESSKPVYNTKLRKKVEFVIELPVINN